MHFLVLHGYAQNGDIFRRKHLCVEEALQHAYPGSTFVYPDAPIHLLGDDKPDDIIDAGRVHSNEAESATQACIAPRGWFRNLRSTQVEADGLNESLTLIAEVLRTQGPFDGILAFSQGSYIAGMVLSLLEGPQRRAAYDEASRRAVESGEAIFPYPAAFLNLQHPAMRFGVLYSGFMAEHPRFDWLYSGPRLATPILHYQGQWDAVVPDAHRDEFLTRVGDADPAKIIVHPGAHHVPTSRAHVAKLTAFVRQQTTESGHGPATGRSAGSPVGATEAEREEARVRSRETARPGMTRRDSGFSPVRAKPVRLGRSAHASPERSGRRGSAGSSVAACNAKLQADMPTLPCPRPTETVEAY